MEKELSDSQSINSSVQNKSSKSKKDKGKDALQEDMSISDFKKQAKADAKKIKVLREMCQEFKVQ
jgi:hypothetical protein